ncbi:MAG TPA: hypothetical protein VJT73_06080 [Polyangiaceae bacterium]|nr:hypothetical protein [Polyangiaceae bacterium]
MLLWLVVLVVPGGLLLLPALIADLRRARTSSQKVQPAADAPEPPNSEPVSPIVA